VPQWSDFLDETVEAMERSILWRRYNMERKCRSESKKRSLVLSKIATRNF